VAEALVLLVMPTGEEIRYTHFKDCFKDNTENLRTGVETELSMKIEAKRKELGYNDDVKTNGVTFTYNTAQ
jgi:hypothetical protein